MGIPSKSLSPQLLAKAGIKSRSPRKTGADRMNGLERAYASHLDLQMAAGVVRRWWFGAVNLRLASGCHYRTDFLVDYVADGLAIEETKGFMRDDAAVKIKWVAQYYPLPVYIVRKKDGGWDRELVPR